GLDKVVKVTMLLAGVVISKPAPSMTTVSPGAPPPRISLIITGQLVPPTTTVRALLVCPATLTLTGPQTASAGTVTINVSGAADCTTAADMPLALVKFTLLLTATGSKPR